MTAASTAANYSDNAVELLEEAEDINLRHQLNILLDPKYKTEADQDQAFKDAREGAHITLSMLKDDAVEKEGETKEILQSLITVRFSSLRQRLTVRGSSFVPRPNESAVQREHHEVLERRQVPN